MARSKEEIEQMQNTLQELRSTCDKFDVFGYSNDKKIGIMIDVLKHNRSEEYINHLFDGDKNVYFGCAVLARLWLDCNIKGLTQHLKL